MNYKQLASYKKCTGCGACNASCGTGAISFDYDRDGHLRPSVEKTLCVNCGRCVKSCPVASSEHIVYHDARKLTSYTAWTKDDELCMRATSGGVFAQLATDFLQTSGATVYGAMLSKTNTCSHICVEHVSELNSILGTKYIQSDASPVYPVVKKNIRAGRPVLFCGTPCQIAGLLLYLGNINKEKLLTVELICHGVPSKIITDLACEYYGADHIISYRDKATGHHKGFCCTYMTEDSKVISNQVDDIFYRCFGKTDRPSCYRCKFASIERIADITLGDQWGLHSNYPERYKLGSNLVICNTEKGRNALFSSANIVSAPIDNVTLNAPTLFMPIATKYSAITAWLHIMKQLPEMIVWDILSINWKKRWWLIPYKIVSVLNLRIYKHNLKKRIFQTRKKYSWI